MTKEDDEACLRELDSKGLGCFILALSSRLSRIPPFPPLLFFSLATRPVFDLSVNKLNIRKTLMDPPRELGEKIEKKNCLDSTFT